MTSAVRLVLPLCFLFLSACDEQGEGERCDLRNSNIDCESGLECVALESLGVNSPGAVCCPIQTSAGARDPVCQRRGDFDDAPPAPPPPAPTAPGDAGDTDTTTAAADAAPSEDATTEAGDAGATSDAGDAESGADGSAD